MGIEHRTRVVTAQDRGDLAQEMARFSAGADGRRWMNVVPDVDEQSIASGSVVGRFFSSRGPVIPVFTWLPEYHRRDARQPTQVGVAHAAGKGAVPRLAERGVFTPPDWVLVQDHQRSGFILAVPPGAPFEEIVAFAMAALPVLSPFEVAGRFRVTFSTA